MTYNVDVEAIGAFESWRSAARLAISHGIEPHHITWNSSSSLFLAEPLPSELGPNEVRVTKQFFDLAKSVVWHSNSERFSLLYTALWRLFKGDGYPLDNVDPLGSRLQRLAKNVRRDIHKMHAFVRFKELPEEGERRRFIAWFEPEHLITEPASSFFAKRFADMDWMIATPHVCATFKDGSLSLSKFTGKPLLPGDDVETLWGTYFSNIFNPARVKLDAMRSEMPVKYWKNMPETALIPSMLAQAEERVRKMAAAAPALPRSGSARVSERYRAQMPKAQIEPQSLDELNIAIQKCQECRLCEMATRAVPGEGASNPKLMIVGEQPGDQEDLEGRVFVGPAGKVLRGIITEAGVDSDQLWMTNSVKHFKFRVQGKRRIHQSPNKSEIDHCRFWLNLEVSMLRPKVILALGATASYAVSGVPLKQSERRGQCETLPNGIKLVHSWHPSYVLRVSTEEQKNIILNDLKNDFRSAYQIALSQQN